MLGCLMECTAFCKALYYDSACRELMVQLMPGRYKDIEITLDYANDKVMKLGELTPEWWID